MRGPDCAILLPTLHHPPTHSPHPPQGGGPYFLNTDSAHYYSANVSVIGVPPFNPQAKSIPPCKMRNVTTIVSSGAFSPFIIPLPVRGTDRLGNPVILELARDASNSSQVAVQVWSALSGKLVYNTTWACGSPSYLYSCPPTNAALPNGLNAAFLTRGTLFFGGGSWSSQQFFKGTISALAEGELDEAGELAAVTPILTVVNASSNQGTWLAMSSTAFASAAPHGGPLRVQDFQAGGGSCARPTNPTQLISTSISSDGQSVVSTPYNFGSSDGTNPYCALRQSEIPGWWAGAYCAGASFGLPDDLLALH